MDTVRVTHDSTHFTKHERNYSLIGFLGGFAVMLLGIVLGVNWLAAVGFVPMVISFLLLNSMLWSNYFEKNSIRKIMRDRGMSASWLSKNGE
jgi:Protein of unknown function (DUF3040).